MKHRITMSRMYVTTFEFEAETSEEAMIQFIEMGDAKYQQELEQCNVMNEKIILESEDDNLRTCSVTDEEMTEGWVVNDGELYFKYEKDAINWCTENGYSGLQEAYDDDVIYWTEWEQSF